MKSLKISDYVLWGLFGLSAIVILLFLLVGYNTQYEENPKFVAPQMLDLLLIWMYVLVAVTAVLTIWSAIKGIGASSGQQAKGLAGKTGLIGFGVLVVSVIIGAVVGAADNDTLIINGKAFAAAENKTDYLLTDISMISIIIMMVATIIALIVSMAIQPKK